MPPARSLSAEAMVEPPRSLEEALPAAPLPTSARGPGEGMDRRTTVGCGPLASRRPEGQGPFRAARSTWHEGHRKSIADEPLLELLRERANKRAFIPAFMATLGVGSLATLVSVLAISLMTGVGSTVHEHLTKDRWGPVFIQLSSWGLGYCMLLVAYLTDMRRWKGHLALVSRPFIAFGFINMLVGLLLVKKPLIPLGTCLWLTLFAIMSLRSLLKRTPGKLMAFAEFLTFTFLACILAAMWIFWATIGKGHKLIVEHEKMSADELVRWSSPLLLAISYAGIAVFAWVRSRYHMRDQLRDGTLKLAPEVQACIGVLMGIIILAWIATALAVQDEDLARLVLHVTVIAFGTIVSYMVNWVGLKHLAVLAERNSAMQSIFSMLMSDWVKGVFVLLFGPVVPSLFALEALHKAVVVRLADRGVLEPDPDEAVAVIRSGGRRPWFQKTVSEHLEVLKSWELSSVLTKSMYCGLAGFTLQVGASKGLVIFLSWFNEVARPWSMGLCLTILFVVEIALFLFPPVAGIPLYLTAGIVLIPKVTDTWIPFGEDLEGEDEGKHWLQRKENWNWLFGIFLANLFCFVLKMTAIALEQKAIGEPFSRSVAVKKFIGVQTSFMKSVRFILSQKGFSMAKVAVLVGGPDWPTSVVTGILGLRLLPMLVGSIPVLFLILPCGFAAGFMLCSDRPGMRCKGAANFCLALAALMQGLASFLAAFYTQAIMDSYQGDLVEGSGWMQDPQEAEVLQQVEEDDAKNARWQAQTRWVLQPWPARVALAIGSLLASAMVAILLNPVKAPFKQFNIEDKISAEPLNGNVLAVVEPLGWISIALAGLVLCCLTIFQVSSLSLTRAAFQSHAGGIELPHWPSIPRVTVEHAESQRQQSDAS